MSNLNEKKAAVEANNTPDTQEKKAYKTPDLQSYGNLSELVQNNPSVANDAGIADCNHC